MTDIFTVPATKQKHTIRQKRKITLWGTKMALEKQSSRTGGVVTGIGAVLREPERLIKSPGCGERTQCKTPQGVPAMYRCPQGMSARMETS